MAYIPLPTGATAVYRSSGLAYYRHSDHLGSSRLASTPSRGLYSSTAYAPYGEPYAQSGTTDLSFTGQNTDTLYVGTNGTTPAMYDFLVRKNSPTQGRWLSPDPAGIAAVDMTNPQSWNRYAYVLNNPMALIDPLGSDSCYFTDASCDPNWGGPINYGPAFNGTGGGPGGMSGGGGALLLGNCADGCIDAYGNDYFDALLGAPGTYLTVDIYGNPGFGFSESLYSITMNFIDSVRSHLPAGISYNPAPGTFTTSFSGLFGWEGLIPQIIQYQVRLAQLSNALANSGPTGSVTISGVVPTSHGAEPYDFTLGSFNNALDLLNFAWRSGPDTFAAAVVWVASNMSSVAAQSSEFVQIQQTGSSLCNEVFGAACGP